jgi:hypothetical protein
MPSHLPLTTAWKPSSAPVEPFWSYEMFEFSVVAAMNLGFLSFLVFVFLRYTSS